MGAVEMVRDKSTGESFDPRNTIGAGLCASMRSEGAMLRPLGDCIVIMPPVAIDIDLLEELLEIIYHAIENNLPTILREADETQLEST
jgi:adenosylmethionine-8-amino-7-oxononanoate aminotransferase